MAAVGFSSHVRTAVLVEGASDRYAVLALARRMGRDLEAEGVAVVAMGGATNVGHFVQTLGAYGRETRAVGLCDAGEVGYFDRVFGRRTGSVDAAGFFVCEADLEDELIRAITPERMVDFIGAQDELRTFRLMQRQPAQRDRTLEQQLHRFIGVRSGRKERYAAAVIGWLDLDRIPPPLELLLGSI